MALRNVLALPAIFGMTRTVRRRVENVSDYKPLPGIKVRHAKDIFGNGQDRVVRFGGGGLENFSADFRRKLFAKVFGKSGGGFWPCKKFKYAFHIYKIQFFCNL